MSTPTSTIFTFLMKGTTSGESTTWTKLIDIKEFPDLGSTPETLETTTLTNTFRTYIPGLQDSGELEFAANYDPDDYKTLEALHGTDTQYAVWLGGTVSGGAVTPTGSNGKWTFNGDLSVYKNGGGVNEVQDMTISIVPSTDIVFSKGN